MATELETTQRRIAELEARIEQSEKLLVNMERAGHGRAAAVVRQTLDAFRTTLAGQRHRLDLLRPNAGLSTADASPPPSAQSPDASSS
jgi:hypothetical protein